MVLQGILPALITPLTESGEIDAESLDQLLSRLYASPISGVYLCGNTGEGMRLSRSAREQMLERTVRSTPAGKLIIAHIGASTLDEAIALARHAADHGAHALSSLPPRDGDVHQYYEKLSAATDLPFLVYYFPDAAPQISTMDQIRALCALPNVAGLKFTDYDLYRVWTLTQDGVTVLNGRDEILAAGLLMGAHGGIGSFYNLVPDLFCEVYDLARAGRWTEAREVQDRINRLMSIVLRYPLVPAIKAMLEWEGIPCGPSLSARPLTSAELESLRGALGALWARACSAETHLGAS